MKKLSSRLAAIQPSATLSVTQKAGELLEQGIDVISFSAGEPDFATPTHIIEAAKSALDAGCTKYTPAAGMTSLRKAIAKQNQSLRNVATRDAEVIVSAGAKHVLYNFFMAVLDEGDEVIIPVPSWVSYPDQVRLAGGVPVFAETTAEENWALTPRTLTSLMTPKSKVLLLNSPSNPTGAVYQRSEMKAVVDCALAHGLYIISDEIYRDLIYDGQKFVSAVEVAAKDADRVFTVDGVSKTYSMTGWRIGWGIGDPEIVSAMTKIQGQSITSTTAISQQAALDAILGPIDFFETWRNEYRARRDLVVSELNEIDGVTCDVPVGAFYVFPNVTGLLTRLGNGKTDIDLAGWLLAHARVAVVPGTPFGAAGHVRLAYATSMERIAEGMRRIKEACARL